MASSDTKVSTSSVKAVAPKMNWASISIQSKAASLEYKHKLRYDVGNKRKLAHMVACLILAGGGSDLTARVIEAMIAQGMVRTYTDQFVSALLGPRTKRINFVFPNVIISAMNDVIQSVREEIRAVGKRGDLNGITLYSNFDLDFVLVDVDPSTIEELLDTNPEWFLGKLEIEDAKPCPGVK